jgi:RHS repeat-associated protein
MGCLHGLGLQLSSVQDSLTRDSTAYAYDAADNATSLADGTGQSFDAANQLCWRKASTPTGSCTSPPSGATTYGYDSRGNRTTATPPSGPVTTLGYDQANRLTSYGTTATYAYDGDGIRASKTVSGSTTRFTWDEAASLPQLLLDGSTAYVYGPGGLPLEQVSGSTVRYYHHDQLGSTRAMTDSTGVVVGTWTYDSYGKVTGSTGSVSNPFGYAGQYTDAETGFQYLRARYYDPVTAQFLTRDPAVATTHSAYGYTGGNPLNGTDPSGLDWRQTIANGAGGVLNGLTLGHEKTVTGWLGISDHVDRCSGAYAIGNEIGKGILVTVATGAAGELLEGAAAVEGGASEAGPTVLSDGAGASPEEIARSTGGPTGGSRVGQSEVRQQLLDEADGSYRCWRCGQESTNPDNMQVGHRNVPTSQGGNLEPENVCLEGASCNLSAGNRGRPSPGMSCVERGGCGAPYGRYD